MTDLLEILGASQNGPKQYWGVPQRKPTKSEIDFFTRSGVPGYAAPDNSVVLSPSPGAGINMDAIAQNESLRILMRMGRVPTPSFDITPEQKAAFKGTPYEGNDDAMRQTIAARIASGDPSARTVTPEQRDYTSQVLQYLSRDNYPAGK